VLFGIKRQQLVHGRHDKCFMVSIDFGLEEPHKPVTHQYRMSEEPVLALRHWFELPKARNRSQESPAGATEQTTRRRKGSGKLSGRPRLHREPRISRFPLELVGRQRKPGQAGRFTSHLLHCNQLVLMGWSV
jgi:hypothetical protein